MFETGPSEHHPDLTVRIILLGNSNSGKTSLVSKFIHGELPEFSVSTVGVDFETKLVSFALDKPSSTFTNNNNNNSNNNNSNINAQNKIIKIMLWDTAGQERYKSVTTSYYRSDGCIVLYDLSDPESYQHVRYWLDELAEYAPPSISTLIVGNKQDILNTTASSSYINDIETLATCQGIPTFKTSIAQVPDVNFIFETLLTMILTKQQQQQQQQQQLQQQLLLQQRLATSPNSNNNFSIGSPRRGSYESQIWSGSVDTSNLSSSPTTGRRSPLSPIINYFRKSSFSSTNDELTNPYSPESTVIRSASPLHFGSVTSGSPVSSISSYTSSQSSNSSSSASSTLVFPSPKKNVVRRPFQLKDEDKIYDSKRRQCCVIS